MNYQLLYQARDFLVSNLDIFLIFIIVILAILYGRNYYKSTLLRIVLHVDTFQESATGQEKLKLARRAFLLTISKRFKFLSVLLDIVIPDYIFAKMVDQSLDYLKDILDKQKVNQAQKVEIITTEITETLKAQNVNGDYNVTANDQIEREIVSIKKQVEDKRGYAKLYAKYSEKEKANIGAEFGIKF